MYQKDRKKLNVKNLMTLYLYSWAQVVFFSCRSGVPIGVPRIRSQSQARGITERPVFVEDQGFIVNFYHPFCFPGLSFSSQNFSRVHFTVFKIRLKFNSNIANFSC